MSLQAALLIGVILVMLILGAICLLVPQFLQQWTLELYAWMERMSVLRPVYRLIVSPAYRVFTRLAGVTLIAMSILLIVLIVRSVTIGGA